MLKTTFHRVLALFGLLAAVWLSGCSEDLSIRKYTVAKTDVERPRASSQPAGAAQRMLGAIVPREDSAWYLKMVDAPEKVAQYEADFRQMIESLSFDEQGEPQFKLPTDWDKRYERQIVYARLTHKEDGVSATLSQLPAPTESEATWRDRVFEDVNRWRGQVSLQPLDWESMQADLEEVPTLNQGPAKAYFVSLTGKKSNSGMSAPFMQGMGMGSPAAASEPIDSAASLPPAANQPLQYDVPDGWEEEAAGGLRLASFSLGEEPPATVVVSTASGEPAMLLDMWFGQTGKEATDESRRQVLDQAETLTVGGVDATLFRIEGSEEKSILVARIPWKDNEALFVKMTGSIPQIDKHRDEYLAFVNSLRW